MAEASPKKPQIKSSSSSEDENGSKYFLYKAALVTLFLVIVPLFPSLAPDFFNQNLHARSWELLQLIFVGIAVSYGLFSKKNDVEPYKENAQSYVSKLLQVSSVFDDESESENHTVIEENKFQALNSQYYRGEPVVVVAKENPAVAETNGVVSQLSQKPLLLPVRSLKQRVPSSNELDSCSNGSGSSSRKSRNGDEEKEKEEEKAVLRSPIPWRSRSGWMDMRENGGELTSVEDQDYSNRIESRSFRPSRPITSPTSISRGEDSVRKKSFVPPPPAPPPPPSPSLLRKSVLMKSSSSVGSNAGSTGKVLARSVRSVPTEELGAELKSRVENDVLGRNEEKESMDYEMKFFNKMESDEKKKEFDKAENFFMDTTESDDSETEAEEYDNFGGGDDDNGNDVGPDVDKKADEFIAKFREQIRLQRIESIRKSTAQRAGKTSR